MFIEVRFFVIQKPFYLLVYKSLSRSNHNTLESTVYRRDLPMQMFVSKGTFSRYGLNF
jgi:hypothetical protein